jgi:hypothetical protein
VEESIKIKIERFKKTKERQVKEYAEIKVIRKREDIHRKLKKDKLVSMPFRLQSFRQ